MSGDPQDSDSNLVRHARYELQRAGMFDGDADYDGAIGPAVMDVVQVISDQEHSGGSIGLLMGILNELVWFKTLTPITSDPNEWNEISRGYGGREDVWQNRRRGSTFSRDGGKTWYDIEDSSLNNGDVWRRDET